MTSRCAGAQGRRWQLGWGGTACEVTERGGPFQGSDMPLWVRLSFTETTANDARESSDPPSYSYKYD